MPTSDTYQHTPAPAPAVKHFSAKQAPQLPKQLTDSLPAHPQTLKPLELYTTMEARPGHSGETYVESPARTSVVMLMLSLTFLLLAYCYRRGASYFGHLLTGLWSVKRTENIFYEHTASETLMLVSLIIVSIIMQSIVCFSAISSFFPNIFHDTQYGILMTTAGLGLFYLTQLITLRLLGWVFSKKNETRIWVEGFNSSQVIMGFALSPIAIIMLFDPSNSTTMFMLAGIAYVLTRTAFLLKSFRIFYRNIFQTLYFISYLCAVEIAPLIVFYKGLFFINEFDILTR